MVSKLPIQVDDDIYMMDQIYTPPFSYNTDTPADQVFLEMNVPFDYCLKDQLKNLKVDTVQYKLNLMKVAGLSHKSVSTRH